MIAHENRWKNMSPQLLRQSYLLYIYIYPNTYVYIYIYFKLYTYILYIYICIYDIYIYMYLYICNCRLINIYNHIYTLIYLDPRRHDLGFGVTSCNPSALGFDPLLLFTKSIYIYIYIYIYIFAYFPYLYIIIIMFFFYLKFKVLILFFHSFNATWFIKQST